MLDASDKAASLIARDCSEIERLSVTPKTFAFVDQSVKRTYEMLSQNFGTYDRSTQTIMSHDFINVMQLENKPKTLFMVGAIDSMGNFTKALPFFAMIMVALELNAKGQYQTKAAILNFVALKQVCYAFEGGGCWMQDLSFNNKLVRLRVKPNQHINNWLILGDRPQVFNIPILINEAAINKFAFRNFGSSSYAAMLFLMNKADCFIGSNLDKTSFEAISMLMRESGAFAKVFESKSKYLIATNQLVNLSMAAASPTKTTSV